MDCDLEARILLNELKYLAGDMWPKTEWGKKNLADVCVVTASRTQVQYMLYCAWLM